MALGSQAQEVLRNQKRNLVIYHAGCSDGFCAAWLFHRWIPQARYVPAQYGNNPPDLTDIDDIYILDFSYPAGTLLAMSENRKVVVLDHHKTAQRDLENIDGGENLMASFDMDKSGARLAWEYLWDKGRLSEDLSGYYTRYDPPWLVAYTEDRDLWKWKLEHSKEVNAALRSYPLEFDVWDNIADSVYAEDHGNFFYKFITEGKAILRYKAKLVDQHVRRARPAWLDGQQFAAVNCSTGDLQSEVAGKLAETHLFGAVWIDQGGGTQIWSLRSKSDDVDVSVIAKKHGGGGHAKAAGFRCKTGTVLIGDAVVRNA